MELDTYILIGEAVIYIISCTINFVIFYKMHKSTSTKLDEIIRKTEPIVQTITQQPVITQLDNEPPDTSRVNRDTAVCMNAYYDTTRNAYELTPKNN